MSSSDDSRGRIAKAWGDFKVFLWNPEDKTVLGRSGKSWAKITLFYMVYYGFLACLFAASISLVLSTLDEYTPKFQTRVQAPGVTIQPKTPSKRKQTSNIIFNMDKPDSYKEYTNQLDEFLYAYRSENQTDNDRFMNCPKGNANTQQTYSGNDVAKACRFDVGTLGECSSGNYGYDEGKPCVLIKVNRIINWYPVGFTDLSKATGNGDSNAPALADILAANGQKYDPYLMYTVCYGSREEDEKNLNGGTVTSTEYFPKANGVGFQYYPYFGKPRQPDYLNPVVAAKFNNVTYNVEINVKCKAYAANIEDDARMRIGYFTFVLKVEKKEN